MQTSIKIKAKKSIKKQAEHHSRDQPVYAVYQHIGEKPHYELGLELAGVFKTWVVPKGPSMDPTLRRFARLSVDKPLGKRLIDKNIRLWDKGSLEFSGGEEAFKKGLERGRITFVLRGTRLRGAFTLFRFVGNTQWLLRKRQDKYARSEQVIL